MKHREPVVEVADLLGPDLSELDFSVLCAEHQLHKRIVNPRVQKPGLAFAGYYAYIKPGRVQIVGESELNYLLSLSGAELDERYEEILRREVPVFICTKGLEPPPGLIERCREAQIPVLSSPALSSSVIKRVSYFLEERLVPSTSVHGVLLEIFGLGVLLIGSSGVGKSECALDLITRGHSLVADDRVTLRLYPNGELVGLSPKSLGHHMELRGIGIINIQDLFGLAAVRERKQVDLVIELERWNENEAYDRLGLDESTHDILGSELPFIRMPVALGRNVSILVEIAARNHLLKQQGHHSARRFVQQVDRELRSGDAGD
jgi:HPr kinase/phosphorylase